MSRNTYAVAFASALMALTIAAPADARKGDDPQSREVVGRNEVEGEIIGTEIAGSPFNKLEIGMSMKQVRDVIGRDVQDDADCGSHLTGKSWIPFHFGGDKVRQECNYKGLGRLTFTNQSDFDGQQLLIIIDYDASEDGYR